MKVLDRVPPLRLACVALVLATLPLWAIAAPMLLARRRVLAVVCCGVFVAMVNAPMMGLITTRPPFALRAKVLTVGDDRERARRSARPARQSAPSTGSGATRGVGSMIAGGLSVGTVLFIVAAIRGSDAASPSLRSDRADHLGLSSMLEGKRIFITGGAGFIGTTLARELVDENTVVAYDNLHRDSLSGLDLADHPNFELVQGDILDADRLARGCAGRDALRPLRGDRRRRHRAREPRARDARERDRHLQRARGGARDARTRSSATSTSRRARCSARTP